MAKVTTQFVHEPDYQNYLSGDFQEEQRKEDAVIAVWAAQLRRTNPGALVGEIIRFQIADGYAQYMVKKEKPLQLVHLHVGDGYQIDPIMIRGLRLSDVRQRVSQEKKFASMFSKS